MSNNDDFKTRLEIEKNKLEFNKNFKNKERGSFLGNAFKLGTEMVAAVVVGTIIGFILDNWFGTKPWLIIIFFFLGAIAGMLNVIKTAKNMQKRTKKMAANPMQQFNVSKIGPEIKLGGIDLSFTNSSLFMVLSLIIISIFLYFGTKEKNSS